MFKKVRKSKKLFAVLLVASMVLSTVSPLYAETVSPETPLGKAVSKDETVSLPNTSSENTEDVLTEQGVPPVTAPPVTEPPVTAPPVTEPPVTAPPVTEPPVTAPPVTEPTVTAPPVTMPPVIVPPITTPPTSLGEGFDITAPVIESITMDKADQKVKVGDSVKISVKAYDDMSGQNLTGNVTLIYKTGGVFNPPHNIPLSYNIDSKQYEATWQVPVQVSGCTCILSDVSLYDLAGNSVFASAKGMIMGNKNQYKYSFHVEGTIDNEKPVISDITLTQQGQTLLQGGQLEIQLKATDNIGVAPSASVSFSSVDSEFLKTYLSLSYDPTKKAYIGHTSANNYKEGRWILSDVMIRDLSSNQAELPANASDIWFDMKDDQADVEAPVITSIQLDQQGKTLKSGELVQVTIRATDNKNLNPYGSAYFTRGNFTSDLYVPLTYDEGQKAYIGTIKIDDQTYPTEWYLSSISIYDSVGNYADISKFDPDFLRNQTCYFRVENKGTLTIPTFDMNVCFYVLDKNGDYVVKEVKTFKDVEKRSTVEAVIGKNFPDPKTEYQNLEFRQWIDRNGQVVDMKRQIIDPLSISSVYAEYNQNVVTINYQCYNEKGNVTQLDSVRKLVDYGTTYGQAIESAKNHALPEKSYSGMQASGWKTSSSSVSYLEQVVHGSPSIFMEPEYDGILTTFVYSELDHKGDWIQTTEKIVLPLGTTRKASIEKGKERALSTKYAPLPSTGWECEGNNFYVDSNLSGLYNNVQLNAVYKDKSIIVTNYTYCDTDGMYKVTTGTQIVGKGKETYENALVKIKEKKVTDLFNGLRFKEWSCRCNDSFNLGIINKNLIHFSANASCENCLIRFLVRDINRTQQEYVTEKEYYDYIESKAVEKGTQVSIPAEVKGFKNINWNHSIIGEFDPSKPFTVDGDMNFYGNGVKSDVTDPVKPTPEPDTTPKPDTTPSTNPIPNTAPGKPLDQPQIDQVVQEIKNLPSGGEVTVSMKDATVISNQILETIRGKDVDVKLNMGGYTWVINGLDILASTMKDINLEVKIDSNAIASNVIKDLAGNNPVRQLSLSHNGDFGFKAKLVVNVGAEFTGKYGNLFYHDSSGKMVYMNAGTIDANGNVVLGFSHASDYAIVIADQIMGPANYEDPGKLSPKTGDTSAPIPYVMIMGMMLFLMAGIKCSKKLQQR